MVLEIPFDEDFLDDSEDELSDEALLEGLDDELRENGFKYDEETGMYTIIPKMLVLF